MFTQTFKKTFKCLAKCLKKLLKVWSSSGGSPLPSLTQQKRRCSIAGGLRPPAPPLAFPSALSCGPLQAGPPPTPQTFKKTFKRLAKHLKVFLNVWRHTAKHLKVFLNVWPNF